MTDPQDKKPKEQSVIKWLLGFKESPDEEKARKAREAKDAATRRVVQQAITGAKVAKKVVDDSKKAVKK